jgi:hypothetical protein
MSSIPQRYLEALQLHPLLTKATTAATLNGLQEMLASWAADVSLDVRKAAKMALYGLLVSGPLGHWLFVVLEKAFKGKTGFHSL